MGRMADARKRAREAAAPAPPPAPADGVAHAGLTDERVDTPADDASSRARSDREPALAAQQGVFDEPAPEATAGDGLAPAASTESAPLDVPSDDTTNAARAEPLTIGAESAPDEPVVEDLVFPADEPRATRPLKLPSSGLAADILSQVAESQVEDGAGAPDGEMSVPAADTSEEAAQAERAAAARAHHFSFFAAPEKTKEVVEATEHLVTFMLGTEEYGVDVRAVQEIIRVPAITAVPRAPVFIRGVINLRGRIIPVVDLKEKLGLGRTDEAHSRSRVLVVRLRGRLIGLLVDGASQVLKVPISAVEAAPDEVLEVDATFIRGVAKLDKRLIILVDLLEVLAPELRAAGATP